MSSNIIFKGLLPYLAAWAGLFLFHNAWAALISLHIAFVLVIIVSKPIASPKTLFKSSHFRWVLLNILLGLLSGLAVYFLRPFVGLSADFKGQMAQLGLTASTLPAFIAYFALVNPLLEEYFWRESLGNGTKGFYMGDLLYAGYHAIVLIQRVSLPVTIFVVACLTLIGWFWRQIKREDGGLLAPVLGHMAADFSILLAVYLIIR
jgi:hypothetical protein